MSTLAPCPGCARHVRRDERACPFCASAISFAPPITRVSMERLGRAAMFTFGAALAATASACSNAMYGGPPDTGPQDDAFAAAVDAGTDTGTAAHYGGPPVDANIDTGGSSSDYGAPPPIDSGH